MKEITLAVIVVSQLLTFNSVAAAPSLVIEQLPSRSIQLAWPGNAAGFTLEQSDQLGTGANWRAVTQTPSNTGGSFSVSIAPEGETRFYRLRGIGGLVTTIVETSPANGESPVAVTRETIFRLSSPLAPGVSVTTADLFAEFGARRLLSRVEVSSDRKTLTLFYLENIPASARVQVTLDGTDLGIDADGDGQPGGIFEMSFDTLGITGLQGTAVTGHVYASEKANGTNVPLSNVTITVDGAEETLRTITDGNGFFRLSPTPAGTFFVHVDGRTAQGSRWPGGAYYPFVGKAWEAAAGRSNNPAGGNGEIFLPLIQADALQPVSAAAETKITFAASVLATNPALNGVEIMVPANSLFSDNGTRGGKVGIAPVPADRLPGPLPPGLNFPLVITVQTDGASNFDMPVPVKFPNLPDPVTGRKAAPGEKTALWSFNHDTGRWEPQGKCTVSADGLFVVTDPGIGIRQPGWHGTGPGSPGGPGGPPPGGPCLGFFCDDPANKCDKEWRLAAGAGFDCAGGAALSLVGGPGVGCASGISGGIVAATRDCLIDEPGCKTTAANNFISGAIGCAALVLPPGLGTLVGVLGVAHSCITGFGSSYGAFVNCQRANAYLSGSVGFRGNLRAMAKPALLAEAKENPVLAHIRLNDRLRAFFAIYYGSEAWLPLDEVQAKVSAEWLRLFAQALDPSGAGGISLTPTEKAALRIVPRPTTVSEALMEATFMRFDNIIAGNFTSAELGGQALIDAGEQLREMLEVYETLGWTHLDDGIRHALLYLTESKQRFCRPPGLSSGSGGGGGEGGEGGGGEGGSGDGLASAQPHVLSYLLFNYDNGFAQRGKSFIGGSLAGTILAPESFYGLFFVDDFSGKVAVAFFYSKPTGEETPFPCPSWLDGEIQLPDADADGLPDLAEFIAGTDADSADTDGDGLADSAELANGMNPLDNQPSALGVISAIGLLDNPTDIYAWNDLAAVADSESGVALFNVANPRSPVLLARMNTPGSAVSVTGSGGLLAVGDGVAGVALYDVSNSSSPTLIGQISLGDKTRAVAMLEEFVVAGLSSGDLVLINQYGDITQRVVTGPVLHDLIAVGGVLYVLKTDTVETFTFGDGTLTRVNIVDSPGLLGAGGKRPRIMSDGNSLYAAHAQGYNVFRLTNPLAPIRVLEHITTLLGWQALVSDGSDIGIGVTAPSSVAGEPQDITLYGIGTNGTGTNFLVTLPTPSLANAVSVYRGVALVADGSSDFTNVKQAPQLSVLEYASPDVAKQPPTITLAGTFRPGPANQISGEPFRLTAVARDDVRVRNVEFLLDGNLVATDGNVPFELVVFAPLLSATKSNFVLQARAFDTAGNSTLSAPVTVALIPDLVPPTLITVTPTNGSAVAALSFKQIVLTFSERLRPTSVNASTIRLDQIENGQTSNVPVTATLAANGWRVFVNFAERQNSENTRDLELSLGTGISDVAGNGLAATVRADFHLAAVDGLVGGMIWNLAENWKSGQVPSSATPVLLGTPGAPRDIQVNSGNAFTLVSHDNLILENELNIVDLAIFNGKLSFVNQSSLTAGGEVSFVGGVDAMVENGGVSLKTPLARNLGLFVLDKSVDAPFALIGTTVLRNEPNALVQLNRGTLLFNQGGHFQNHGQITHAGTNTSLIVGPNFQNFGEVQVFDGRLELLGGSENYGVCSIAQNGTLLLGNAELYGISDDTTRHRFASSSRFEGTGLFQIRAAQVQFDGSVDFDGLIRFDTSRGLIAFNGITRLRQPLDLSGETSVFPPQRGNEITFAGLSAQIDHPVNLGTNSTLTFNQSIPTTVPGIVAQETSRIAGNSGAIVTGNSVLQGAILGGSGPLQFDGSVQVAGLTVAGPAIPALPKPVIFNGPVRFDTTNQSQDFHSLNQGAIRIETNGVFDIVRNARFANGGVTQGNFWFENFGIVRHSASNITQIELRYSINGATGIGAITNHGTLEFLAGEVRVPGIVQKSGLTLIRGGHLNTDTRVEGGVFRFENGQYTGDLTFTGGQMEFPSGATLPGDLRVFGGNLTLPPQTLSVASFLQTNGTFQLSGGTLVVTGGSEVSQAGLLTGFGTIQGSLDMRGSISPGSPVGTITITQAYNHNSSGRLIVDIGGTSPGVEYDQLKVNDLSISNGTLEVRLVNGFNPQLGAEFHVVVTSGNRAPNPFRTVTGQELGAGKKFQVIYEPAGVKLRVVAAI